jgi:hypothetical protein
VFSTHTEDTLVVVAVMGMSACQRQPRFSCGVRARRGDRTERIKEHVFERTIKVDY